MIVINNIMASWTIMLMKSLLIPVCEHEQVVTCFTCWRILSFLQNILLTASVVKILSHFEVKLRETELKSSVIQFWYPDTMTKCKRYIWIVISLKYLLAILHTFVKLSLEEFRCLSRLFLLKWSAVIFNSNCLNLQ